MSIYFHMQLNALSDLIFPTNTDLKNWCQSNLWAERNSLQTYVDMNTSPAFFVGNSVLKIGPRFLDKIGMPASHFPQINSLAVNVTPILISIHL